MNKGPTKFIAAFHYFDKIVFVLSPLSGGISISSFDTFIGAPER